VTLDHVLPPDLPAPRWNTRGVVRALGPLGLHVDDVLLLCSVCAPQHGARGLQRAVFGLARLYPDDARVSRWCRAAGAWSEARPDYRSGLVGLPRTKIGPVTRFLGEVTSSLPQSLARAILARQLQLLAAGRDAEAPCYRLYLAARHLRDEGRRVPDVHQALQGGRFLDAIATMAPPSVHEPPVLEAYRAALRNALGSRKAPERRASRSAPKRRAAFRSASRPSVDSIQEARSLCLVLAAAARARDPDEPDEDQLVLSHSHTKRRFRRSGGLTTNRAKAIPQGLGNLDALRFAILLRRLDQSDLDPQCKWKLHAVLTITYLTGWPTTLLMQLGSTGGPALAVRAESLTIPGGRYAAEVRAVDQSVQLTPGREVVRLLRSVLGPDGGIALEVHGGVQVIAPLIIRTVLRHLSADDACPTTLTMLRGAIWHVGRALGWTPELLVLVTCTWDPAFARAFHYLSWPASLDMRPLHDAMGRRLQHGLDRLRAIEAGNGFARI
jgi:hypothetical protein